MLFTSSKSHAAAILLASLASACANQGDYLSNRDTITLQAGEAVAANAASQMIDPWAPHAARKDIAFDGARMGAAVDDYRHGRKEDAPAPSTFLLVPQAK